MVDCIAVNCCCALSAGVGGYFCATSPNESQLLAGRALPPSEAKGVGATGTPRSDGEPLCTVQLSLALSPGIH